MKIKAFKINAVDKTVEEVLIDSDNMLQELYRLIGCDMVERVMVDNIKGQPDGRNMLWLDEEGLLKDPIDFFYWKGLLRSYAGNAVLTAMEEGPEDEIDVDVTMSLQEVQRAVAFITKREDGKWILSQ